MRLPPFEIVPHTADIGLVVRGRDTTELLVNSGRGLNAILFRSPPSGRDIERDVHIESADADTLLIDWLNELLYLLDGERLAFSLFEPVEVSASRASVRCLGERYDPARHHLIRDVKAATYHMAGIRPVGGGYEARVILDI